MRFTDRERYSYSRYALCGGGRFLIQTTGGGNLEDQSSLPLELQIYSMSEHNSDEAVARLRNAIGLGGLDLDWAIIHFMNAASTSLCANFVPGIEFIDYFEEKRSDPKLRVHDTCSVSSWNVIACWNKVIPGGIVASVSTYYDCGVGGAYLPGDCLMALDIEVRGRIAVDPAYSWPLKAWEVQEILTTGTVVKRGLGDCVVASILPQGGINGKIGVLVHGEDGAEIISAEIVLVNKGLTDAILDKTGKCLDEFESSLERKLL